MSGAVREARMWLIERHGYLTPLEARERLLRQVAVA